MTTNLVRLGSSAQKYLTIAGHVYLAWLCWLITVLVFAVTVAYAFHPSTFVESLTTVGSSISNSILTLRLLSGIIDIMLSVSFAAALDRLQVISINAPGGDLNMQQASTNALTWTLRNTEGVSFFNASRAPFVAAEIDRIFSNSMTTWLSNSEHAVDITPDNDRIMSCAQLLANGTTPTYERVVYMPGSVPVALVADEREPEADIQIAFDIKGYVLRFGRSDVDGSWSFNASDCITLGVAQGAARLCLANNEPNIIQATWHQFLGNTEEDAPVAVQDLLAAYKDFALASGSMANFQKWSSATNNAPVGITDTSTDSYVDAISDMLDASGTSNAEGGIVKARIVERQLESSSDDALAELSSLFGTFAGTSVSGSNPIFPIVPYLHLQVCNALAAHNPRTSTICTDFLQNFLAISLSWCDNLMPLRAQGGGLLTNDILGPTPSGSEEDSTATQVRSFLAYLGLDDATAQRLRNGLPDTRVALAKLRYEIVVGRPSLFAYMAISSVIFALCFAILVAGTRELESPGYWPLLDAMIKYALMSNGQIIDGRDTCDLNHIQRRLLEDAMVITR
ncbi:hypothetical protein LTR49_018015 [Elasticomyces elasticus]|nr:hypothetical protein LTR49_018015 [Elasticomyces elasticus]